MAEYIERDEAIRKAQDACIKIVFRVLGHGITQFDAYDIVEVMESVPVADVVEVKHGEWLPDYETFVDEGEKESEPIQTGWVCSLCGRQEFNREPYCHCGAKMDGKDDAE